MKTFLISFAVAMGAAAYDLHTPALTPIAEEPAPAGAPVALVEGGRLRFAIAWNLQCETNCGAYKPTRASIGPALQVLTNVLLTR